MDTSATHRPRSTDRHREYRPILAGPIASRPGWHRPRFARRALAASIAAALFATAAPQQAHADDFTWTGSAGAGWGNFLNWSPGGGPPNSATDTAIFNNMANGSFDVELGGGTFVVNQLQMLGSTGNWALNNGTVTFDGSAPQITIEGSDAATGSPGLYTLNAGAAFQLNATTTFQTSFATSVMTSQGQIIGTGGLIKTGDGLLVLDGTDTYQGGTMINAGTVSINNSNALGTGDITVGTGDVTKPAGLLATANATLTNPNIALTAGSTTSAAAGVTFTLAPTTSFTFGSPAGGKVVIGSSGNTGTVVIDAFLGANVNGLSTLEVAFGTLQNGGGLGNITEGVASVTVDTAATLDLHNSSMSVGQLLGTGSVTLGSSSSTTLTLNSGNFGGVISGAGQLDKIGMGPLTLSGASTYSGGTTILGGTLSIANGSALGVGDIVNNAALVATVTMTLANPNITLAGGSTTSAGTGTILTIAPTSSLTVGSVGGGNVVFGSSGNTGIVVIGPVPTETVNSASTLEVAFGTLQNGGGLGNITENISSTTVDAAAKLDVDDISMTVAQLLGSGAITLGSNSTTVLTVESGTFSGAISGAGQLDKTTAGTLTLSGTNTYSGGTTILEGSLVVTGANGLGSGAITITGGSLQVGNGGTTGSISPSAGITDNASLVFDRSSTLTQSSDFGTITGLGSITQAGTGTTVLTAANTYTGGTTISAGAVQLGNGGSTGTLSATGTITDNATLILDHSGTLTQGTDFGTITGSGAVTQIGTGTAILTGTNTYTGVTSINSGVISVDTLADGGTASGIGSSSNAAGNLVLNNGTLRYTGAAGNTDRLFTVGTSGATIDASGTGPLTFSNTGAIAFSGSNTSQALLFTGSGAGIFAPLIGNNGSGPTSVNVSGTGSWTFLNDETYTGGTTISGGSLQLGNGGTTGGLAPTSGITDNANLTFNRSDSPTQGTDFGTITGSGTVTLAGSGTVIYTAQNSYTGGTTITAGTLQLGNAGTAGSLSAAGTITDNAALAFDRTNTLTQGIDFATITGTGTVTQLGTGTTILTAANTYTGGTTISAGILQLGSGSTTGSLSATGTITDNATLVFDRTNTLTQGTDFGTISGSGAVTQSGTGTTILTGTNTYTGVTTISSGVVSVDTLADGGTASGIGSSTNDAANLVINGGTLRYTGGLASTDRLFTVGPNGATLDVSGTAALTFSNSGAVAYSGANTAEALTFTGTGTGVFAPLIGDNGTGQTQVKMTGSGTWTLTSAETYTGATTISSGTLQLGDGGTSGSLATTSAITDNGNLAFNRSDTLTQGTDFGAITGSGSVTQAGAGTTILLAANTYTGGTIISTGTLQLGNGGTMGSLSASGTITDNGSLVLDRSDNLLQGTDFGTITGTGSVTLATTDTVILTAANSYTGGTTIGTGATLQIGNSGATGSLSTTGIVNNGGSLVFNRTGTLTQGVITGAGTVTQSGPGTTILIGANTYTGATTVNAGTLQVDGSLAAGTTVAVNSGGRISGNGTINGAVNVQAGGTLAAGGASAPDTLTIGTLTLDTSSISDFRLVTPNVAGGGLNDLISVTGGLTLAGTLNVTPLTGFGVGTYTLFTYGGALTGPGISTITGLTGFTVTISTAINHEVDLIVSLGAAQYWDGTGVINNNVISGGSGTWNATTNNWTNSSGSTNSAWQSGTAIFGTTGGTVTLGTGISAQGLIFSTTGYVINGTSLNLTGAVPTVSVTNAGDVATISAKLTGTAGLTTNGAGTLILTNAANSYTGGTTINHGTLQIGTTAVAGGFGAASAVTILNGGNLSLVNVNGTTFANNVTNGQSGTGTLTINSAKGITLSGALTDGPAGHLGLTQSGAGTTILTNAGNNLSGATTISKGVLQIGTATAVGALGAGSAISLGEGATLSLVNVQGGVFGSNITNGLGQTGLISVNATQAITMAGNLTDGSGTLAFTKSGTGTVIFYGNSTYTGATTVTAGTLQFGDGVTSAMTGTSAITVSGTAGVTLNLSPGSTFARTINLNGTGTTLKAIQSGTDTLTGVISGTGVFDQNGIGTTILGSGVIETYTGATNVNAGTLEVDASLAAGSTVNVGTAGTLVGTGTIHGKATLTGNGVINFGAGGNIVGPLTVTGGTWSGGGTVGGLVTSSSGVFNLTGTLTAPAGLAMTGGTLAGTGTLKGSLNYTSSSSGIFGGVIQDGTVPSSLTMNKAGSTLTLTGSDTYMGPTNVSAGILQIGNGSSGNLTSPSTLVTVSGTGSLVLDLSNSQTFLPKITLNGTGTTLKAIATGINNLTGVISGTGVFDQNGTGTTVLGSGVIETYTGATNVNAGTLEVDATLAQGSTVNVGTAGTLTGTGTIHGNATLTGGGIIEFSAGGNIQGTLSVTGGNWNLLGGVTGLVTSSSGLLTIGTSGVLTAPAGLAVTGGTLAGPGELAGSLTYTSSASSAFNGTIADGIAPSKVTVNKAGTTLILTGANSYTGATTISAGTLQLGDGTTAGSKLGLGSLIVSGTGSLAINLPDATTFSTAVNLSATGTSLQMISAHTNTVSGVISGVGAFDQNGIGKTVLNTTETYTGPTNINAGTLEVDGSLAAGSKVNVGTAGTLTGTATIHGNVSLTGGGIINFTTGTIGGTLTVTGGNWNGTGTVDGLVTSSSGIFTLGSGSSSTATLTAPGGLTVTGGTLAGSGNLIGSLNYTSLSTSTFRGKITGSGSVTMNKAASTLILTGANTYSGATMVSAGTLQLGDGSTAGSTFGTGAVTVSGSGVLILDLPDGSTFSKNVSLSTASAALGNIQNGKTTITGVISGPGKLSQGGIGTTVLGTGIIETYTGATSITAGTLEVDGTLSAASTVTVAGVATLSGSGDIPGNTTVLGGGAISLTSGTIGGTLTVTGGNWNGTGTVTKLVTANGGVFTIGSAGTLTASAGLAVTGGTLAGSGKLFGNLTYTSTASSTFAGVIANNGATASSLMMNKAASTLTLTGANTYTGPTTINAGTLALATPSGGTAGSLASSNVAVSAAGTLAGNGTLTGTVNLVSGAHLSPGATGTAGTLTIGTLFLNTGAITTLKLSDPTKIGGTANDDVSVTSNLTLAGVLDISLLPGFQIGTYTIMTYGGTLTGGFSTINAPTGFTTSISTSVAHDVNLTIGLGTVQYWDGSGTPNDSTISGGAGTWNSTTDNWTNASGAFNSKWLGGTAVFGAPGGTVTIASAISAQALIFGSTNYVLNGPGTLGLTGTAPTISVTNKTDTATLNVQITGTGGLNSSGAGTLILGNAANSYSGGTMVTSGLLQVGVTGTPGSLGSGAIRIGVGGTLTLLDTNSSILAGNVSNSVGGSGTLVIDLPSSMTPMTLSGTLTNGSVGQLNLTQSGAGTTILTNAGNTYTGATTISAGVLQVGTAATPGSIGAGSAVSVGNGATLSLVNVGGGVFASNVTDNLGGTGLISSNVSGTVTLSGALTNGSGTLTVTAGGAGTTILSGNETYSGVTTVTAGTLQIGNGANTFSGGGTVAVSPMSMGTATLAINLADGTSFAPAISLSATGSTLKMIGANSNTLTGVISGSGVFDQNGTGKTILSAAETYTGATNVNGGTLEVDGSLVAASAVAVGTSGTLTGNGTINGNVTLTGNGTIGMSGTIAGTLGVTGGTWSGSGSVTGLVTASSGAFRLTGSLTAPAGLDVTGGTLAGSGTLTGALDYTSSVSSTFGGIIAGSSSTLTLNNAAATLTITGASTYTGATTVTAGNLTLGNGATAGTSISTSAVTVASGATLTTNLPASTTFANTVADNGHVVVTGTSNSYTLSGVISGTGDVTKTGTNGVIVTGANTYSGGTVLNAGALAIDNTTGSGTGTGPVTINTGSTLGGNGTISGAMILNKGGILQPGVDSSGTAGTTLHAASLMWNPGGTLTLQLGATGDELVLTGALTKGTTGTGTYTVDILKTANITQTSYTLASFASTTFDLVNFNLELPTGVSGHLVETTTSLVLDIDSAGGQQPAQSEMVADTSNTTIGFDSSSDTSSSSLSATPTPEPGSALLLAFGGAGLLGWRRRRR